MQPQRPTRQLLEDHPVDRLGVLPWAHSSGSTSRAATGHDPRSTYVESFWLPVLGPSVVLLLRRFADEFERSPDGFEITCAELSREIGLGSRITQRAPFVRTVDRCIRFQLAELQAGILHVRRQMPSLSPRQTARLSARQRSAHETWQRHNASHASGERRVTIVRAAHLAHTLLTLGETPHDIERQLHAWSFEPSVASHALQWAEGGELAAM